MFDWDVQNFTADYSLNADTLKTGLSGWDLGGDYTPQVTAQTSMPTPTPTGGFFSDALKTVQATAGSFLDGVSKIYALDNQISAQKIQQKQIESGLKINELKTTGGLELQQAQLTAQKEIGVLQAQEAINRQKAQTASSSGASFVTMPSSIPWPLIGIVATLAIFVMKGKA